MILWLQLFSWNASISPTLLPLVLKLNVTQDFTKLKALYFGGHNTQEGISQESMPNNQLLLLM